MGDGSPCHSSLCSSPLQVRSHCNARSHYTVIRQTWRALNLTGFWDHRVVFCVWLNDFTICLDHWISQRCCGFTTIDSLSAVCGVLNQSNLFLQSVESTSSLSINMEFCSIAELPADREGKIVDCRTAVWILPSYHHRNYSQMFTSERVFTTTTFHTPPSWTGTAPSGWRRSNSTSPRRSCSGSWSPVWLIGCLDWLVTSPCTATSSAKRNTSCSYSSPGNFSLFPTWSQEFFNSLPRF